MCVIYKEKIVKLYWKRLKKRISSWNDPLFVWMRRSILSSPFPHVIHEFRPVLIKIPTGFSVGPADMGVVHSENGLGGGGEVSRTDTEGVQAGIRAGTAEPWERGAGWPRCTCLSAEIQFVVRVGFSVCSQGIMNFSINVVGKIGGQVKADP